MKSLDGAYVSERKEVVLDINGRKVKLYVNQIGFAQQQSIAINANNPDISYIASLISASVTDESGSRMTYDEALRLKKEYAEPLCAAISELLDGEPEKN